VPKAQMQAAEGASGLSTAERSGNKD